MVIVPGSVFLLFNLTLSGHENNTVVNNLSRSLVKRQRVVVYRSLVDSAVKTATKMISCFLPIDDTEALCSDLQKDELVKRELSNIAGLLVVKGGRLVALGSALFQVARHIKFKDDSEASEASGASEADNNEAAGSFAGFAVENQNLNETEGSDANKIESGFK